MPEPVLLDLGDFDAVGVAGQIVVAVRSHAITTGIPTVATVAPPPGWHTVRVTAAQGGGVTLHIRAKGLTVSRWNNVYLGLLKRENVWIVDDDSDGITRFYAPGADPTDVGFELLAALTVAGAPHDARQVTILDVDGTPVALP